MRKNNLSFATWIIVLLTVFAGVLPASATLYLEDNFNYNVGNLYKQGSWVKCGGVVGNNPIQVTSTQLSYTGYAENEGKSVELNATENMTTSDERLAKLFTADADTWISEGSIYYSFLLNVKGVSDKENVNWIAGFQQRSAATWGDNAKYDANYGSLYVKKSSNEGKFLLGIARHTSTKADFTTTEYEIGTTYLVVVKYQIVCENTEIGEANDVVSLWVNPVIGSSEPAAVLTHGELTGDADFRINTNTNARGLYAFQLVQYNVASRGVANVLISNLRIADTWSDLLKQSGDTPEPEKKGSITVNPTSLGFYGEDYAAHKGTTYTGTVLVKATNIEHDITVGGLTTGEVTASANTIAKEDAMSDEGYTLTLTLNPVTGGVMSDKLVLSCADAEDATVELGWYAIVPTVVASVNEITETEDYTTAYQVTGPLTITHRWGNYIYLQDANGGAVINDSEGLFAAIKVDDCIKDLVVWGYTSSTGVNLTLDENVLEYTLVGHDMPATPVTTTLANLAANGASFQNRLVKVTNVTFGHKNGTTLDALSDGETFTTDYTNRVAVQDDSEAIAEVRVLSGSDFIGNTVPARGALTGLSTAASGTLIAPRTAADISEEWIEPEPEPAKNLLGNGSFESWSTSFFGASPKDWTTTLGECSQETANVLEGVYALRLTAGSTSTAGKLEQDIYFDPESDDALIAGQKYKLTLHYLVETATSDGTDLLLQSYWSKNGEAMTDDADLLDTGEYFTSDGAAWTTKEIIVTAPEGANHFYLKLKVGKKAKVLFDNFSFAEYNDGTPSLLISDELLSFSTTLGETVTKELTITAANITNDISLEVTGDDAAQFSVTPASIPAGQAKTTVTVTYAPTAASAGHYAALIVDPLTEGVGGVVALIGQNYDPANKPEITLDPTSLEFEAEVGTTQTKSVTVTSANVIDRYVTAKVVDTASGLFLLEGGTVAKNGAVTFEITFVPRAAGTFTQQVEFAATFADTAILSLTGTATGSSEPVKEGDDWPLSTANPLKLMIQGFDGADATAHNKALSLDGWKNIAEQGGRAWWGFAVDGEDVAKVTAYKWNSDDYDADMWLITPALDFKNAESKVFTFDIMGQYLSEDNPGEFEVYYMAMNEDGNAAPKYRLSAKKIPSEADGLYYEAISGLNIPTTSDESDTWYSNQINFTNLELDDVFFIGFRYSGTGGSNNSSTYYIDNVTWGDTSLPVITPSVQVYADKTETGKSFTSSEITVSTQALTEDVTLTLGGDNADNFALSTTTIDATGGKFTFTFSAETAGTYYAYVTLASQGAATVTVIIGMEVEDKATGIDTVNVNAAVVEAIYDLNGRKLVGDLDSMGTGVYIVRTADGKTTKVMK